MNQVVINRCYKIELADGENFPKSLGGLLLFCDHIGFALTFFMGPINYSHLGNKCRFFIQLLACCQTKMDGLGLHRIGQMCPFP